MVIIGIRLQTWTRVIVNRCIGKIITRDLSLMASDYIDWLLPAPGSHATVTLSPSFDSDLLGGITVHKNRNGKKALYIHAAYILIQNRGSRCRLVDLNGDLLVDSVHRKTSLPLAGGKNLCQCHLYRAEFQRREEEKRQTRNHPKVNPSSII